MGRGRRRKPTAQKILEGNPGKRDLNPNEPMPPVGVPDYPAHLDQKYRANWDHIGRMVAKYGVVTELDAIVFELAVRTYTNYLDMQAKAEKGGAVWVEHVPGQKIPKFAYSPFWATANREFDKLMKILGEMGMTPAARSKVTLAPTSGQTELELFLADDEVA